MSQSNNTPLKIKSRGPHSRTFKRGALGSQWDGRSSEGKFLRTIEKSLTEQLGHEPSAVEQILIRRASRTALQLELLDKKFSSRNWTMVDGNIQGGLANSLRLTCRELGLSATSRNPKVTLAQYIKEKAGQ